MYKLLIAGLAAISLAACDPTSISGSNSTVTSVSTALHAVCNTAETVLPIVSAYAKAGSLRTKLAIANDAVAAYCSTSIATDLPSALHNLTVALAPILPYAIRIPAAVTALHSTPTGRQILAYANWQGLR